MMAGREEMFSTAPKTVVGHGQVENQAPAARCVLEIPADLMITIIFVKRQMFKSQTS
jgi:hypothetical protein